MQFEGENFYLQKGGEGGKTLKENLETRSEVPSHLEERRKRG